MLLILAFIQQEPDEGNILGNENFTFVIDTFHDRRNDYLFQTNAAAVLRLGASTCGGW